MRTRTENDMSLYTPTSTGTYTQNGASSCTTGSVSETLAFPYYIGSSREMSDVVVPSFHARSAKGEIFNNPMSSVKTSRTVACSTRGYNVSYTAATPANKRFCSYQYAQNINNSTFVLNEMGAPVEHLSTESIGVQRLRDLAGTQAAGGVEAPVFEGATFVAELAETISFLRNPMGAFVKRLEGYRFDKRARKYLNHQTVHDYVSQNWLRYRYGVRPIVYDMENALEAIAQTVVGFIPERKTSRGGASTSVSNSASGTVGSYVSYDTETTGTVSVRTGVLYEASRSPDTFGIGAPEIAGAVWEAIPWSFVVDWFLNVGTFIDAIKPVGGITRLASWTTVSTELRTQRTSRWTTGGNYGPGQPRIITSDGAVTEELVTSSKTRTPGISVSLATEFAPLSGSLGQKRIADLAAVAIQILKSK